MSDKQMGFMGHIAELRRRIFFVAVFFVVAFVVGMFFSKRLIIFLAKAPTQDYLSWLPFVQHVEMTQDFKLIVFRVTDPMFVYLEFAFFIAFVLTMPLLLYQLWAFIRPGLYENERRITLAYIPTMVLMF